MNRVLYLVVALALLFGSTQAGTVILSGTCTGAVSNNNFTFTLANSGNDSAVNLVLVPYLSGAIAKNSVYNLPSIGENSTTEFEVNFSRSGLEGTYSDYFILGYEQGSGQEFSALFPCLASVGKRTISEVYATTNVTNKGKVQEVNVSLFNNGPQVLQADVSLLLPPAIAQSSQTNLSITLTPFAQKSLNFSVKTPPSGESYSAAVGIQYVSGGEHYASQSIFVVSGQNAAGSTDTYSYLPFALIIIVILAVLAFMTRRIIHNRSSAKKSIES